MKVPHGVLQQLRQDVVQRQRDEREACGHVPVDSHSGGVSILMFTQTPEEHVKNFNRVPAARTVSTEGVTQITRIGAPLFTGNTPVINLA